MRSASTPSSPTIRISFHVVNRECLARRSTDLASGGPVIATGEDEFLFAGIDITVTFSTTEPGWQAGILSGEEGRFMNGTGENVRWLNGDQTHQERHLPLEPGRFTIQQIKLYRYR
jgi:hypothetical protein